MVLGTGSPRPGLARMEEEIRALVRSITAEASAAMGRPDRVEADCARLGEALRSLPADARHEALCDLVPLLGRSAGAVASPLFGLIEQGAAACCEPWKLVDGMLGAREAGLVRRALGLAVRLAESNSLRVTRGIVQSLAGRVESEGSPLADPAALHEVARIVRRIAEAPRGADPVLSLYLNDPEGRVRRLAGRILDLGGQPPSAAVAEEILGPESSAFLRPYLDYTRATHLDLLLLRSDPEARPAALQSLRRAAEACGESLLREVIANLGWERVSLGMTVTAFAGAAFDGSLPLMLPPEEAAFLESCTGARIISESWLIVAHGGVPSDGPEQGPDGEDVVARFRAYNLAHAEALGDILDVAPLDRGKVRRILERMDRIVAGFVALFAARSEECSHLPAVYGRLRERITSEMDGQPEASPLSPEISRLVQAFEDPPSLAAVGTLHGLKRYLHQKGLQLGLKLIETAHATNRSVGLVVASRERVLRAFKGIHYVDFEPAPEAGGPDLLPYPVALAAEGLGRQMLRGLEKFPSIRIFCYGNEVHYYLAYGNHPAFLRVDYSPPLQGGMIDLEYYGVSKYELSAHPAPALEAIRAFFRELDFDVQVDNTRIHARYDKERALGLEEICGKAAALFRLAPYLMEVDWVIGDLRLSPEARREVAAAWARRFALSGAVPIAEALTQDRQQILAAVEAGPTGEREIPWTGEGPYRDRFSLPVPEEPLAALVEKTESLGLHLPPAAAVDRCSLAFQIPLEERLLGPLREAAARGEIVFTGDGPRRASPDLYRPEEEPEVLARILESDDARLSQAATLGQLVARIERALRFRTTGSVDGYVVQRARLPLRGGSAGLFVLRDAAGIVRLALYARGDVLFRRRERTDAPWEFNGRTDAAALALLMRLSCYVSAGPAPSAEEPAREAARTRALFARPNTLRGRRRFPGEVEVTGLRASPGRAVGRAVIGTAGRTPPDLGGAVLVAPVLRPEDNAFLYRAAGIVSTGGGILSHAGLIATQFQKPALIVPGRWRGEAGSAPSLVCAAFGCREEEREVCGRRVIVLRDVQEREIPLRDGDLVVLDADEGALRVLGQDHEALALHDGLRLLHETNRLMAGDAGARDTLALRGRRLRARHQIEKVLTRITDPALARHAVREILLGGPSEAGDAGRADRARLLSCLLAARRAGGAARSHLLDLAIDLACRHQALREKAEALIPSSGSLFEILGLRLDLIHARRTLEGAAACLRECGIQTRDPEATAVDGIARRDLEGIREGAARRLEAAAADGDLPRARHTLRLIDRIDLVLGRRAGAQEPFLEVRDRILREEEASRRRIAHRRVLGSREAGFEIADAVGWKAANLAEAERLAGAGLAPPWFVVTHRAFEEALGTPVGGARAGAGGVPLREAIDQVSARADLDPGRQSAHIRALWESVALPEDLVEEVTAAYRSLAREVSGDLAPDEDASRPFVAVRSSAREEDAEAAARAGEFETYLFVRSEEGLVQHLKRAWSGLWTERAIHNRAVFGAAAERVGGGVIVQRVVRSRTSGVMQTINVAEREFREMVVNVGLGLGEGIVSGAVAADHVVVAREGDLEAGPLRFRYVTADKRDQVVFDRRRGGGTTRAETLYHQRLRPALEYADLCGLIRVAARLEADYGYPLDIEFGIEGSRLWILQVRPVAVFLPWLRETLEHHPLAGAASCPARPAALEAIR